MENSHSDRRRPHPSRSVSLDAWKEKQRNFNRDELTGLLNQDYLKKYLDYLDKADPNSNFTIIFLDLNHFKNINDSFGHQIGDRCLQLAADILSQTFRTESSDLVFRNGGDEFVVVTPSPSDLPQETFYENLRQRLRKNLYQQNFDSSLPKISFSIGFATKNSKDSTLFDTLRRADDDMYLDKKEKQSLYACHWQLSTQD